MITVLWLFEVKYNYMIMICKCKGVAVLRGFPHLILLSPSDQRKFSSGSSLIQFESDSVERPLNLVVCARVLYNYKIPIY